MIYTVTTREIVRNIDVAIAILPNYIRQRCWHIKTNYSKISEQNSSIQYMINSWPFQFQEKTTVFKAQGNFTINGACSKGIELQGRQLAMGNLPVCTNIHINSHILSAIDK